MTSSCFNPSTLPNPSIPPLFNNSSSFVLQKFQFRITRFAKLSNFEILSRNDGFCINRCTREILSETESEYETEGYDSAEDYTKTGEDEVPLTVGNGQPSPHLRRRPRRYRREYPGERKGISEEMRFVAMKLRNEKSKRKNASASDASGETDEEERQDNYEDNGETWEPSVEGFLKYLVDNLLVFSTIERIVDESTDVSYVYFRKTGLERSGSISRDLEWFREMGNVIPEPSNPGIQYTQYLKELAEKSPPLFLSHFYNIYFSHISGGQMIAKQVSNKLFEGRELEFYRWEGDAEELLRGVRENLNALGEHWSRDEKNRCLKEATKAFRFLGQIVRLIILM